MHVYTFYKVFCFPLKVLICVTCMSLSKGWWLVASTNTCSGKYTRAGAELR